MRNETRGHAADAISAREDRHACSRTNLAPTYAAAYRGWTCTCGRRAERVDANAADRGARSRARCDHRQVADHPGACVRLRRRSRTGGRTAVVEGGWLSPVQ